MYIIFIFILGLIVGSFLNVVIYRLKNGGNIFISRSKCPHCKKKLKALDMLPVLSFVFYKGRCRYCKKEISWQYPIVELGTAIIFITTFINLAQLKINLPELPSLGDIIFFILLIFVLSSLLVIFVYDLKYYLIPDVVLFPSMIFVASILVLAAIISKNLFIVDNIIGALIFSGFFFVQYFISKGRWVGGGDIKLGFLLGLVLGWQLALVCLFLAYIIGASVALSLILLKQKTRKDIMPFGPFLIASFVFCLFYGPLVLNWYLNFVTR